MSEKNVSVLYMCVFWIYIHNKGKFSPYVHLEITERIKSKERLKRKTLLGSLKWK